LAAVAVLAILVAVAFWQRRRRPLFALGTLWFFAGHVLTATIIPLLLAFEHRNYFPSAGLLLAAASIVVLEGPLQRPAIRALLACSLFLFYAGTTFMRAQEWADPNRLIASEASKRPDSAAAQYERANTLFAAASRSHSEAMIDEGLDVLEKNRHLAAAGINYEQLLITESASVGKPVSKEWWNDLAAKLRSKPPNDSDAKSLANLNRCFIDHVCTDDQALLAEAYDAALSHGQALPVLLQVHAEFAWWLLKDQDLAERQLRAASALLPRDFAARRSLVVTLIARGELDEARREFDTLTRMNTFGIFDRSIRQVRIALEKKQQESNAQ
jgi:hypothetical protein